MMVRPQPQASRQQSMPRQRGMVLVTSLLLLIVVTILAISMFRSFGLDEKIAGNVREKQRALSAAETAEQYAEYWLASGNGAAVVTCTGMVTSLVGQVCSNTALPANFASLPWQYSGANVGVTYLPERAHRDQLRAHPDAHRELRPGNLLLPAHVLHHLSGPDRYRQRRRSIRSMQPDSAAARIRPPWSSHVPCSIQCLMLGM